jgi:hypothetical protein
MHQGAEGGKQKQTAQAAVLHRRHDDSCKKKASLSVSERT